MIHLAFSEDELDDVRERITRFIDSTVADAGASGAVVGLSGGIDSALTASLTADALGRDRLRTVSLPAAVSAEEHVEDARDLADRLGVDFEVIDVEPIVQAVVDASRHEGVDKEPRGNARARARAVLSYLIANEENLIVVGTGNRTEALVGYFTKYGDGAVDCHPIGNLYKCQVRQLARHMEVPERIVEKTPTAELWADQTDEEELGIDYDVLDRVLALHVDGPLSRDATARHVGCDPGLVDRVDTLVARSAHKRSVPPSPAT